MPVNKVNLADREDIIPFNLSFVKYCINGTGERVQGIVKPVDLVLLLDLLQEQRLV